MTDPIPRTVSWHAGQVRLIDQRALPGELRFVDCATVDDMCNAITSLTVRGAPALGATGAYGVALAAGAASDARDVRDAAARLVATRPTAVNLAWGVGRAMDAYERGGAEGALAEAERLADEDVARNRALGAHGAVLLGDRARVLTHCNAGSLACVGYGTAVGVIRAAAEAGKRPRVWVDETRPVLQGARLTAWELDRLGIDATVVVDAAAASLMGAGEVDCVVVGADRIAANGDVANKVGTYALAVLAHHHDLPFYVAAPTSTIDLDTPDGAAIVVEQRDEAELTTFAGVRVAPEAVGAHNPAFDVTPAALVTAIVTEQGILRPPSAAPLARFVRGSQA
ncbi:MAG: methylthioribose-phosphate isomerase [Actinomycetota bacterium]|nr:methylthioribose-phosphate isomerase [Actinomycetota bacterium]